MNGFARGAAIVLLSLSFGSYAAQMTPAMTQRYHALLEELRCLVCQNESLNESNADLAQDLRDEVRGLIRSGASDAKVIDYLVARYGDFVLYRPQFKPITYLLWFAPFFLLIVGLVVLFYKIRRMPSDQQPLSPQEQRRLQELLREDRPS
jgi:cytochrome c-type biogenesis protein CcmH